MQVGKIEQLTVAKAGEVMAELEVQNKKLGTTKVTEEKVKDVTVVGPQAEVGLLLSRTINLGNYESVRVQVSLTMPCLAEQVAVDHAYEEVKAWVDARMGKIIDEASVG